MPQPNTAPKPKCVCCNGRIEKNRFQLVFDDYGQFRRIQFLLAECVNKLVTEIPGSKQAICTDCLNQLEQNYAFKLRCSKQNADDADDANGDDGDDSEKSDHSSSNTAKDEPSPDEEAAVFNDVDMDLVKTEHLVSSTCENSNLPEMSEVGVKEEIFPEPASETDDDHMIELEELASLDHMSEFGKTAQNQTDCGELEFIDETSPAQADDDNCLLLESKYVSFPESDSIDEIFTNDANDDEYLEEEESVNTEHELLEEAANVGTAFIDDAAIAHDDVHIPLEKASNIGTSFIDSLTVHSIKEKIRKGIPTHCLRIPPMPTKSLKKNSIKTFRPSKAIATMTGRIDSTGDLIDILEGQDEDGTSAFDDPESFVPKLTIEHIGELNDESDGPVDIDDYVMSIVAVSFCEFSPFVGHPVCEVI